MPFSVCITVLGLSESDYEMERYQSLKFFIVLTLNILKIVAIFVIIITGWRTKNRPAVS